MAPLAIYLGRPVSSAKLKQNIRKLGGKFVEWGKQNEYVVEYFVYGSTGDNSDVLLLFSGAFSPGDLWQKLHGENNVDVWGKRLGLKVICITNGGLGCSSLPSSQPHSKKADSHPQRQTDRLEPLRVSKLLAPAA